MRAMKTLSLLLSLFFLAPAAFGQEAVNPARVSAVPATKERADLQLADAFRAELRAMGCKLAADLSNEALNTDAEGLPDYAVSVAATPNPCGGYSVSMVVLNVAARQLIQGIYTGDDLQSLAKHLAARFKEEFFKKE